MMDMHIHSTYSDGRNSPEEIIQAAVKLGYRKVAVCDHVRHDSEWLTPFFSETARLKEKYAGDIKVYTALEAKLTDFEGSLDLPLHLPVRPDIIYAAVHRIPAGGGSFCNTTENRSYLKECWLAALRGLINCSGTVFAHPLAPALNYRFSLDERDLSVIAGLLTESSMMVEINTKYLHPAFDRLIKMLGGGVKFIIGSDSHSVKEMYRSYRIIKRLNTTWGERCGM
jgi:histidinol phosphatase-like PHP family hydrolase